MNVMRTLPRLLSDTGQKKTPEKKDGRRMSFQRPKGTIEYSVSKKKKKQHEQTPLSLCNVALCFGRFSAPMLLLLLLLLLSLYVCVCCTGGYCSSD